MKTPRVILVTDPSYDDDTIVRVAKSVAEALPPGAFAVQVRDKVRGLDERRALTLRVRDAVSPFGALLVVNGDLALAREVAADGVHLGGDAVDVATARRVFGGKAWISVAAHSDDDIRAAVAAGADAALVSPIFATGAKVPRGVTAIEGARRVAPTLTLYALGGVTFDGAAPCAAAGAYGAALIRALFGSPDPAQEARAIHDVFARAW